jgi:NAD(P) transhydrogenase
MLDLFRRPEDPPEYGWLWAIPGALFAAGLCYTWTKGENGLVQAGYTVATFLSIGALTGLSAQVSVIS